MLVEFGTPLILSPVWCRTNELSSLCKASVTTGYIIGDIVELPMVEPPTWHRSVCNPDGWINLSFVLTCRDLSALPLLSLTLTCLSVGTETLPPTIPPYIGQCCCIWARLVWCRSHVELLNLQASPCMEGASFDWTQVAQGCCPLLLHVQMFEHTSFTPDPLLLCLESGSEINIDRVSVV